MDREAAARARPKNNGLCDRNCLARCFASALARCPFVFNLFRCPCRLVKVGRNTLGGDNLLFILGPCVIETAAFTRRMGRKLKTICDDRRAAYLRVL